MKFNLTKVKTAVSNKTGLFGAKVKANSPEILLVLGIATMAGAVVTAAIAGKKQERIAADHLERLKKAKETDIEVTTTNEAGEEVKTTVVKSEEEVKKDVTKVYGQTVAEEVKNWGATAVLMGASIGCFVGMHNIQAGRIAGLSAAYTGVNEAFKQYRDNVIKLHGDDGEAVDSMCKNGFNKTEEKNEDGSKKVDIKPKTAEERAEEINSSAYYTHEYVFSMETAPTTYRKNRSSMFNLEFLDSVERGVQTIVNSRGYCTADEAARAAGIERDKDQIRIDLQDGWVRGGKPVSFGHRDVINNETLAGYGNREIILSFNVDGNLNWLLSQQKKAEDKVAKEMKES